LQEETKQNRIEYETGQEKIVAEQELNPSLETKNEFRMTIDSCISSLSSTQTPTQTQTQK
jgi:hypothetical protein